HDWGFILFGLGTAWNVTNICKESSVCIFGLGIVGLSLSVKLVIFVLGTVEQGARLRGTTQIIGVDTNAEKYDKGKSFRVTEFINPNDCNEPVQ
ncbi:hypothetical protein GIB67_004618, partial [Kingdonia uniflora]